MQNIFAFKFRVSKNKIARIDLLEKPHKGRHPSEGGIRFFKPIMPELKTAILVNLLFGIYRDTLASSIT